MNNRLQFVHHNEIFKTSEEAIQYVLDLQKSERPSLFGEPMVLLYENEEDPSNPYMILAIGSRNGFDDCGDGETLGNNNRTYFFDLHTTESKIADVEEKLLNMVETFGVVAKESDTIKMSVENSEAGTAISGEVKLSEYEIFEDEDSGLKAKRDNSLISTSKGLFVYVDAKYNEEKNVLSFYVNGNETKIALPSAKYIESGKYDIATEELKLYYNDDLKNENPLVIDMNNLIEEWKTEEEDSDTPIVLVRERIKNEEDGHKFQDVLKGDVRISSNKMNILERDESGKALLVKGTADNIYYKGGNVEDTLDELKEGILVSTDDNNIIIRREDGLYATVDLKYDTATNTLKFKNSREEGYQDIVLNSAKLIQDISYDSKSEQLVIRWVDANGEVQKVFVPVGDLFEEMEAQSDEHSVKLDITRTIAGHSIITGDVKVSDAENNILKEINHALFVDGTAKNIKYDDTSSVKEALDALNEKASSDASKIEEISSAIEKISELATESSEAIATEKSERESADSELSASISEIEKSISTLDDKIGTGFTDSPYENVTYKFEQEVANREALEEEVDAVSDALATEVDTRKSQFDNLSTLATENQNKIGSGFTANQYDNVTYKFEKEVSERVAGDEALDAKITALDEATLKDVESTTSISMENTDGVIKSTINLSGKDGNILDVVKDNAGDGVYASVDVTYDENTNKLTLVTNKGSKEIQLVGVTAFEDIKYNPLTETVDIKVTGKDDIVRIPVGAIIQEWKVSNSDDSPIVLTLGDHDVEGTDILSASVKVSALDDNILEIKDGSLYVSNADVAANAEAIDAINGVIGTGFTSNSGETIADKLAQEATARENADSALDERVTALEDNVSTIKTDIETINTNIGTISTSLITETENRTNQDTILQNNIDALAGDAVTSVTSTNAIELTKDGNDVSAELKLSGNNGNILKVNSDGLYTKVNVEYDSNTNEIIYTLNDTVQKTQINGILDVTKGYYTPATETVTIEYRDMNKDSHELTIDVSQLAQEWTVSNDGNKAVELTLSTHDVSGKDVLSADVKIVSSDVRPDNILVKDGSRLYVPGTGITANAEAIATLSESLTNLTTDYNATKENVATNAQGIQANTTSIEGLDTRVSSLESASTDSATAISDINTKIDTIEKNVSDNANSISDINTKIGEIEKNVADNTTNITNEVNRATAAENKLTSSIEALEKKIDGGSESSTTAIDEVKTLINNEITRATDAESALESKINANASAITSANTAIEKVDAKVDAISGKVDTISTTIDELKKTDSSLSDSIEKVSDKYDTLNTALTTEITRALTKEGENTAAISAEVERAKGVESTLEANLNNEITRAKDAELALQKSVDGLTTSLGTTNDNLSTEVERAKAAENALDSKITEAVARVKVSVEDTQTVDITMDDNNVIKADVVIAKTATGDNGNIILASSGEEKGAGLFASVNLSYNAATNVLTFETSGGASKEIQLNAGTLVDSVAYDNDSKSLVITYKTIDGSMITSNIPVSDFFTEWDVEKGNHLGGIILSKELDDTGTAILSAQVVISDDENNMLVNDNGVLKVDGSKFASMSGDIETLKEKLESEIKERELTDRILSASVENNTEDITKIKNMIGTGFTGVDGDNITNKFTEVDNSITTVNNTITGLSAAVQEVSDGLKNVIGAVDLNDDGTFKPSEVVATNYLTGQTTVMGCILALDAQIKSIADTISSLLDVSDTLTVDMTKSGSLISGDVKLAESSLSNLLEVVEGDTSDVNSKANGLYYDGSVDYGQFEDGSIEY